MCSLIPVLATSVREEVGLCGFLAKEIGDQEGDGQEGRMKDEPEKGRADKSSE